MNPDSACAIGLLPEELKGRVRLIGNAAGEGARIAVLDEGEYRRCDELMKQTEFLELAMDMEFQDIYVEELEFPEKIGEE